MSQSPTSSSFYWQSNFCCNYHWTLLVKNSAVLVTKQADPARFPEGLPWIIFVFMYCQFVPLGQILLQVILQDSGSKWKPRGVTFHCQLCTDVPLCTALGLLAHISLVAAEDLHLSKWRRKWNSIPDSHPQASALWASNSISDSQALIFICNKLAAVCGFLTQKKKMLFL